MNIKNFTLGAMTAALLVAPAFAGDHDHDKNRTEGYDAQHREYSNHTRYEWTTDAGQTIMFKNPVSFEGEVTGVNASHTMIKADNGMIVEVPKEGLVWNGDTQLFAQNANLGDRVVLHLRQDEPYRVISQNGDELAIGSYEGVFFVPKAFINDIALDDLDGNIYRDSADVDLNGDGKIQDDERDVRRYDNDLKSASDRDND